MPSSCVGFRVVSSFSVCEERVFVVGVIFQKMSVCVSQSVDVVFFSGCLVRCLFKILWRPIAVKMACCLV